MANPSEFCAFPQVPFDDNSIGTLSSQSSSTYTFNKPFPSVGYTALIIIFYFTLRASMNVVRSSRFPNQFPTSFQQSVEFSVTDVPLRHSLSSTSLLYVTAFSASQVFRYAMVFPLRQGLSILQTTLRHNISSTSHRFLYATAFPQRQFFHYVTDFLPRHRLSSTSQSSTTIPNL